MLDNYKILNNGIIKQINVSNIIKYDNQYVNSRYNSYGELTKRMSYLRLGFLIGSIGYTPNSILDVGYGNGDFLKTCSEQISECYGTDISGYSIPENCKFIEFDEIFNYDFDVITFFDSLEHFENIYFIKNLKCKYIIISVPECHNFNDEWFQNWKHRRENEHLYHFNKNSLKKFFEESGYELINMTNVEDNIRKPIDNNSNILTAVFKKII